MTERLPEFGKSLLLVAATLPLVDPPGVAPVFVSLSAFILLCLRPQIMRHSIAPLLAGAIGASTQGSL